MLSSHDFYSQNSYEIIKVGAVGVKARNSWPLWFQPGLITGSFWETAVLWLSCWGSCNARCPYHPELRVSKPLPAWDDQCPGKGAVCHCREQLLVEIYTFMVDHTDVCAPAYLLLPVVSQQSQLYRTGPKQGALLSRAPYSPPTPFIWLQAHHVFKKLWKAGAALLAETKALKPTGRILHPDLCFLTSPLM